MHGNASSMPHEAHAIWTRTTEASACQFGLVTFQAAYAQVFGGDKCGMYVAETGPGVLRRFDSEEICTLVVVGKLREGYDNKYVSAVAMHCAPTSHVLFSSLVEQFARLLLMIQLM